MNDHECMEEMLVLWEQLHSTPENEVGEDFFDNFDRIVKAYIIYYNL